MKLVELTIVTRSTSFESMKEWREGGREGLGLWGEIGGGREGGGCCVR